MKQLVKHIVAGAMLGSALVSTSVMAEQKVAVVDVQGIFQAMPQAAEIQNAIQAEFKDQLEEVNQLQRDGQFYAERLQRDAATMSDAEKKELEQKIKDKEYKKLTKKQLINPKKPIPIFDGRNILNKKNFSDVKLVTVGINN